MMRSLVAPALLLSLAAVARGQTTIPVLHFSDYHSHAVPFYAEGETSRGGIARAIGYLKREKEKRSALVFSGGDMINKGSPAWSDRFQCAEWPWLNGIADAMAYGNHDSDYGPEVFAKCREALTYPILGSNVVGPDGKALFTDYVVLKRRGVRIGVFAVAGSDFETLVKPAMRPRADAMFTNRIESARRVVAELRQKERVDAVILIGHAHREEDFELARAVSGIDVILGTHSHIKEELTVIPGTATHYISPFQYLMYISRVELHFDRKKRLKKVTGRLVPVDRKMREDAGVARRVAIMQRELESDPSYRDLFAKIGVAASEIGLGAPGRDWAIGNFVMDIVRAAANADAALSTSSSFRHALPPGEIRFEDLRAALPYPNQILVYEMKGSELRELLTAAAALRGGDAFPQVSGLRIRLRESQVVDIRRHDGAALSDDAVYKVATTDYLAKVNPSFRRFFTDRKAVETGLEVRDQVRLFIEKSVRVSGAADGRIGE